MCGAEIPRWIERRLSCYGDDMQSLREFGFDVVANMCDRLKTQGVDSFHFYSMNHSQPSLRLAKLLDADINK
jgi:methylenetetrahydrofolate reductase (NADPH)